MISGNKLCKNCENNKECENTCKAMYELAKMARIADSKRKNEALVTLGKDLDFFKVQIADDIREIAERIIPLRDRLSVIEAFNLTIGYVRSIEPKKSQGKPVYGECIKVKDAFKAWLPFDFVIVVYAWADDLTDEQLEVLVYHELRHVDIGSQGPRIRPHDVEDFRDIIDKYGIDWIDEIERGEDNE